MQSTGKYAEKCLYKGNIPAESKTISVEERDMYWHRSEIHRYWLLDKVFKTDPKDSVAIMIFPIEVGKPNYCDSELL